MQAVVHSQDPHLNISYYIPDTSISPAPVAQFSVNLTPSYEGTVAQFFSQANYTYGTVGTQWFWNFTNGGTKVDSISENPQFTYTEDGVYSVNLTVVTPYGTDQEVKTNYILILDPTPTPTPCPTCDYTNCTSNATLSNVTSGECYPTVYHNDHTVFVWVIVGVLLVSGVIIMRKK